ncbi:methyl-accepting chemotaxis protein [Falsiroseomonas sp. CW058]|uniref:methyl-accepting chemotaxis protein n=1 Tax=Falsiroseomonas sp. CW058 TaxID=3388664 RepID=UPI003D316793
MRDNGPVTDREILVPPGEMLVSRTDAGGRITFCNGAFITVSGFDVAELTGAPHNIVRHRDMPKAAFRDLWETIGQGRVWEGLVKNRTKAGDFYWVRANVTPVMKGGKLDGYISIRVRPGREEVAAAAAAYDRIQAGDGKGIGLRNGAVVATGLGARLGRAWRSVTGRIGLAAAGVVAMAAADLGLGASGAGVGAEMAATALGLGFAGAMAVSALALLRASLADMQARFDQIATGDFHSLLPDSPAAEFGGVLMRLRGMRAQLGYAEQERAEGDRRAAEARTGAIQEMAGRIEEAVRGSVDEIRTHTATMAREADGMAEASGLVRAGADGASAGAGLAFENVQAVAAATEQLAASVREITEQATRAGGATQRAVEQSRHTEETIRSLATSLGSVEQVVTLIRRIAEQTNLLALNATIEAARAGDAGKGFAVVAGEVKTLATQTARSTEEITRHIAEILAVSRQAVSAAEGIGQAISEVCSVSGSIAAAMEQQAAATQEIARNVNGSSDAVRLVSERAGEVRQVADNAGDLAEGVRRGAAGVDRSIGGMREALVRLVRTSMAEAERRGERRHEVEERCLVQGGGVRAEATMRDVSRHGCRIGGLAGIAPGATVEVSVPGWGLSARFRVIDVSERGHHLDLVDDGGEAWMMAVERRFAGGAETRRAA